MRNLVIVLGDQLNDDSAIFDDFDRVKDAVWMAEVAEEASHVWTHKGRISFFLSAMRHFEQRLVTKGYCTIYRRMEDLANKHSLRKELLQAIELYRPEKLVMVEAGEFRVQEEIAAAAKRAGLALEIREDRHFLCSRDDFRRHTAGRKQLRMEYFYREMRRRHNVLMEGDEPIGGQWNFDKDNRSSFGRSGPGDVPTPVAFPPDRTTKYVMDVVELRFPRHPGELEFFDWPVTAEQAEQTLHDFIEHRLPHFGAYQDAMWMNEPYLHHSRISAAMNVKLLNPLRVIESAELAYRQGKVPLAAAEGFIRQILGWREYVRGVYWHYMPDYIDRNELGATNPLPKWFWTGKTDMNCMKQVITQTIKHGYAHHIQRLMVTGLYSLLAGIDPKQIHEWYLSMFIDAVEWVSLPNTLGMSQYADGGIMASKPYVASGKYIQRMSNYCEGCRFNPANAEGDDACPFTTMYWQFLEKHRGKLGANPRMSLQLKNLDRRPLEILK